MNPGLASCGSLEGTLTLQLSLARLAGVSQLDGAELLTRAGRQREDGLLLYHYPSPCLCWQLLVKAHFSLQKTQRYFTDVERSLWFVTKNRFSGFVLEVFSDFAAKPEGLNIFELQFNTVLSEYALKTSCSAVISTLSVVCLSGTQTLCRCIISVMIGSNSVRAPVEIRSAEAADSPWLWELQPFEVSHLSFIRRPNNSEVPVDIRQNSRTVSIPSSVCVGEESPAR